MITETILQPQKGDRARITPKNINIAIIPLEDDRTNITAELTERLAELRGVQELLGEINDCNAASALLREMRASDDAERFKKYLAQREENLARDFRRKWREEHAARERAKQWRDMLAHPITSPDRSS